MPAIDHKITPMLWFDGQAEEAARLYVSVFPDSSIGAVSRQPDGTPLVVEFALAGRVGRSDVAPRVDAGSHRGHGLSCGRRDRHQARRSTRG